MTKRYYYVVVAIFFITCAVFSAESIDAKKEKIFGAALYLNNSVGAGTAFQVYQQDPRVSSTLYVHPYMELGPFWGERKFKMRAELSTSFEWIGAGNPFLGTMGKKFSFGDFRVRAYLKNAVKSEKLGLSLLPSVKLEAPLSKGSRVANRILGLGINTSAKWSKWGMFVTYKPAVTAYVHSASYKSSLCDEKSSEDDKLGDGYCKVSGRQTMVRLKNSLYVGYGNDDHTVTLGFSAHHSFLRAAHSGEKLEKKPSSNIMEATLGFLEYSYKLPVSVPFSLAAGIESYQSPYDAKKSFRIPFFDFTEPNKNETSVYVTMNVVI